MNKLPLQVAEAGEADQPAAQLDVQSFRTALAAEFAGEVHIDRLSRALYSTDASIYQIVPLAVLLPKTAKDIVHVVTTCAEFRVPITARGGGTSQAGQAIGAGVILDCSKFYNEVLEINAKNRWVRVQPGCVLAELNDALKSHGLQFAPDISTANRATIGGMIANNSSGTRSVVYGKTIDHVLELKVLLSDGSVIDVRPLGKEKFEAKCRQQDLEGSIYRTAQRLADAHAEEIEKRYPKILRRVGGYNLDRIAKSEFGIRNSEFFSLTDLFVGSEGTLGIVLEATLKLVELPKNKSVLVVQFANLLEALAATPAILEHQPSAVEVMDRYILDSTKLNPEASRLRSFLQGDPGAILIIEFFCDGPDQARPKLIDLETDLHHHGIGEHFLQAIDPKLQQRIWKLRTLALGLSMAEKGDAKSISFVEDTAVRPKDLRDYIAEFLQIIEKHGTKAGVYAHASVGCLHVRPVINLKTAQGVRQLECIANEVADLVLKYNGALSGEHGDGLVRSPFQEKMYGPVLYQAFRELKQTFDPQNIFNPGKIVDAPPLASNLRFGPAYVTPQVATTFDFTADGGMVQAAELCSGVGECRKKNGGMMCPSYRATRDEKHSTRGRANALRLAITGQCELDGLNDPALLEALDLCLECKACKSECPTNVDMARLKAEFLHQHYRRSGLPRRNRILANIAALSRWGYRFTPMSNWFMRSRALRWLNHKLLGLDYRRIPPKLARRSFAWQFASLRKTEGKTHRVLIFPDTFTNYYQPEIGMSAAKLLIRFGCEVTLGKQKWWCCGRPMISTGMLEKAAAHAELNILHLHNWVQKGGLIMACEPSCILTIKDDYPALLRRDLQRRAKEVAAACFTFEELMEMVLADSPSPFLPAEETILVQGHCHQRALTGMTPTMKLLQRIPGAHVVDLDAGCCGMAGAFGYEKEHYELSRKVGEQQLFPALRQSDAESMVIAPGFSCRMQIEHFVKRKAYHPAELLAELCGDG